MEEKAFKVVYTGSYKNVTDCPSYEMPEYCFIGRSNVGKSSIINLITGLNEMARTSRKPGKTQSINLFQVHDDPAWVIADLPGYGYAQISRSIRGQWASLIDHYILERRNLMCTFLLLDIRHPRMENDRAFMNFLGQNRIPFCILFTKSDKLKPEELKRSIDVYVNAILNEWEELPPYIVTSSIEKTGRDEILTYIRQMNTIYQNQPS